MIMMIVFLHEKQLEQTRITAAGPAAQPEELVTCRVASVAQASAVPK